jgi:prevent-host-death family protein
MQYITLTEAKAKLSQVIEKAMAGEEITITRMGKPAVELVPSKKSKKLPLLGLMQGKGIIYDEATFNEWPEEEARALGIID